MWAVAGQAPCLAFSMVPNSLGTTMYQGALWGLSAPIGYQLSNLQPQLGCFPSFLKPESVVALSMAQDGYEE